MRKYSTGLPELDALFGGYQSTLTEFYGEQGTGKTTLSAYWPITRIAVELKEKFGEIPEAGMFIMLDGDGGFDFDRAEQIWKENGLGPEEIKKHLYYKEFTAFKEHHNFITKELEDLIEIKKWKPLLVTFDPATAIYRGIVLRTDMVHRATTIGTYTGKLDLQLGNLRHLGVLYDCPIIVSSWPQSKISSAMMESQLRKESKELSKMNIVGKQLLKRLEERRRQMKPEIPIVGGRAFGFLPKIIVELRRIDEASPMREAYLFKARGLPSGRTAKFKLSDKGIEGVTKEGEKP